MPYVASGASSGTEKGDKFNAINRLYSFSLTWPAMLANRPRAHHMEVATPRAALRTLPNQPYARSA